MIADPPDAPPSAFLVPPAIADPDHDVSRAWIIRFSLLWFGFWMAQLVPINLLLPSQLAVIDPQHYLRDFGILNATSGVAALVTLPLFGALCDRTRSSFGRRRVWMLGGTLCYAAALLCVGLVHSWEGVAAVWTVTIIGVSMATAGLTAVMADRVPDHQRGVVSGAIYGPQALGIAVGVGVISAIVNPPKLAADMADKPTPLTTHTISVSYVALAVVLVVTCVAFIRRYVEVEPETELAPLSMGGILDDLWISPSDHPDFAWAFGGRTLVNLANSFGTSFLIFFLTKDLHRPDPTSDLLVLTLVYLVFTLIATALSSIVSDRTGRRRIFVAGAAGFQATAGILIGLFPGYGTGILGAALLGAGYGAYMAVDQALVTEVLPDATSKAKDLGIMNIGSVVPQALGPVIGTLIISELGGYSALYLATGVVSALGAAMVYKVRSVR